MKRIPITDAIKAAITSSVGEEINFDTIAVFEAIAVTGRPISKKWSIFDGAVVTRNTMEQAAAKLNTGEFVPLHTLHEQGYELPVGRLFQGTVGVDAQGINNLHTLFYTDDTELAAKLDNGIIEEVSVGLMSERMLCSGCNFDYADPANEENLWTRVCDNGHVLGMGGYHLLLDGVKKFMELSLVSKGASTGAKILGAKKRLLASQFDSLAASGNNLEHKTLFASPTLGEEIDMKQIEELQAGLKALTEKVEAQAKTIDEQAGTIKAQAEQLETLTKLSETVTAHGETLVKVETLAANAEAINGLVAADTGVVAQLGVVSEQMTALKAAADAPAAAPIEHPFKVIPGGVSLQASAKPDPKATAPGREASFKIQKQR